MRPSPTPRLALTTILIAAILLVLFADILAVSATAAPLPTGSGAVLKPISPANISRPYNHSSFQVSSRLLDGNGQPIANAPINILQQVLGQSRMQLVEITLTHADGSFTATIPPGPSRLIDLAYRATEGEKYAAQTEVQENVRAGLRLRVTPRHTTPTGTIQLEGQVLGDVPTDGVVIEVLVYYLGQWQPIRTPRTRPNGRLLVDYRFHQATGEFPFRLRIRYGQVGFPYGEACSSWVEVLA